MRLDPFFRSAGWLGNRNSGTCGRFPQESTRFGCGCTDYDCGRENKSGAGVKWSCFRAFQKCTEHVNSKIEAAMTPTIHASNLVAGARSFTANAVEVLMRILA